MERRVLERMIGAAVLVAMLVIGAPALLDGRHDAGTATQSVDLPAEAADRAVRTVRIKPGTVASAPAPRQETATNRPATRKPEVRPAAGSTEPAEQKAARQSAQWVVQLGSFASRQNAEQLTSQVRSAGWPVSMSPHTRSGKTLYRVRVEVAGGKNEAQEVAGKLKAAGYAGQVIGADT
jgi:cell division septation protein DedD